MVFPLSSKMVGTDSVSYKAVVGLLIKSSFLFTTQDFLVI